MRKLGILIFSLLLLCSCETKEKQAPKEVKTAPTTAPAEEKPATITKGGLNLEKTDKPSILKVQNGEQEALIEIKYGYDPDILFGELKDVTGDGVSELILALEYTQPVHTRRTVVYKGPFSGSPRVVFGADYYRATQPDNVFKVEFSGGRTSYVCRGRLWGKDGRMVIYEWKEALERFVLKSKKTYGIIAVEEVGNDGTTSFYELRDRLGCPFPLPQVLLEVVEGSYFTSVSPSEKYLAFIKDNKVMLRDLETGKMAELMKIDANLDGISNSLWSEDGNYLSFITIPEKENINGAMVTVLQMANMSVRKTQKI